MLVLVKRRIVRQRSKSVSVNMHGSFRILEKLGTELIPILLALCLCVLKLCSK